jgi:hypothetical protein
LRCSRRPQRHRSQQDRHGPTTVSSHCYPHFDLALAPPRPTG